MERSQRLAGLAYVPFGIRQMVAEVIEAERLAATLTALGGAPLLLLAEERFSGECFLASETPFPGRSKAEVFAEVARETARGVCEWPGELTPRANLIRYARGLAAFGG
jgi:hypothetical protein